ncbi:MAG: cyclic nucleotide-binding domain-containing protein [Tannerellaceae bacterium]|nr:cyclic nucleotide-binding domain-containing protein [Tannerellaceae bacterium]
MKADDGHFARLLADLPEPLSQDLLFIRDLQSRCKRVVVKKGDYLLRAGEVCQNAYFINKGLFINQYINDKGNECVTGFSSDDQYPFLSVLSYFTKSPSEFEIKAIEDGELICISRQDIEELSLHYPPFAAYYQNAMLVIISKLYTLFTIRQSCTAEEFMSHLYNHYAWLVNRIPDKYIACYMGISKEWYCKLKKRVFKLN